MTLTPEERAELTRQLAAISDAYEVIEEQIAPQRAELSRLAEEMDTLLEAHAAEIAETCGGCGCPIFVGDLAHLTSDAAFCVACAPTWQDIKDAFDANPAFFDDPHEDDGDAIIAARKTLAETLAAREAAGTLSEKYVWEQA